MAEIRIRRKHHARWWPVLLVLLVPLAWYLFQARSRQSAVTGIVRDTGSIPAPVPLPPIARTPAPEASTTPAATPATPRTAPHATPRAGAAVRH